MDAVLIGGALLQLAGNRKVLVVLMLGTKLSSREHHSLLNSPKHLLRKQLHFDACF